MARTQLSVYVNGGRYSGIKNHSVIRADVIDSARVKMTITMTHIHGLNRRYGKNGHKAE